MHVDRERKQELRLVAQVDRAILLLRREEILHTGVKDRLGPGQPKQPTLLIGIFVDDDFLTLAGGGLLLAGCIAAG